MEKLVYEFAYYIKNVIELRSLKPNFTDEIIDYIYDDEESSNDKLFIDFYV